MDLFSFLAGVVIGILMTGAIFCLLVWVITWTGSGYWPAGDESEDWRQREPNGEGK